VTIADDKAALRTAVRARRRARSDAEHSSAAASLAEHTRAITTPAPALVAAYLSLPTEPGTDEVIAALARDGHAVWVPRIVGDDLVWVGYRPGDAVQSGPMGIREPLGPAVPDDDLAGLDLVLLPGLACDVRGHRLGQGGGYYDRLLARLDPHDDGGPLRVVVLFDDEVLEAVPVDDHDARVDGALTPSGYLPFG
jgi:5-formyltetrahydrofolate cyclo-ligase